VGLTRTRGVARLGRLGTALAVEVAPSLRAPGLPAYLALMATAAALAFVKGFTFARLLGPRDFAYYAVLDLVVSYGAYAGTFGLLEGLNREIPVLIGGGDDRQARTLSAHAGGAIGVLSLLALAVYVPAAWWLAGDDRRLAAALSLGGALAVVNNMSLFTVLLLLAQRRSIAFAGVMTLKNGAVLGLGGLLAASGFGLWGAIGGEIAAVTGVVVFAALTLGVIPGLRLGWTSGLARTFAVGVPMMFGALVRNLGRNLDRLVVGGALGVTLFGQYSFAMLLVYGGIVVLNPLVQYVTPRLCHAVGAGAPLAAQRRKIDLVMAVLVPLAALAYVPFGLAVDRYGASWFPGFEVGLGLMRLLYFAGVLELFMIYQAVLVAAGAGELMVKQAVAVSLVSAALCLTGWWHGAPIVFYAWSLILSRVLAAVLVVWAARSGSGGSP